MHFGKLLPVLGIVCLISIEALSADADKLSDVIKANNDFNRTLIESRLANSKILLEQSQRALNYALANKEYALADYLRVRTQHLQVYIGIMSAEYNRVQREEANLKERMYQVRVHYDMCGELADGNTRRGGFQCLQYFRRYVISFALQKKLLFDDKVEPLPASEFTPNYPDLRSAAFPGGNLGQLLMFAESKDLSFVPYGKAHTCIMGFLEAVQNAAQAKVQEYRNWIDGIRAGTLDVFRMPSGN